MPLSTVKMSRSRSIAAAVDKKMTVIDSHNLKYNSGTCCTMEVYSPPVIPQGNGEVKGRSGVKASERALARNLPCDVAKLVER